MALVNGEDLCTKTISEVASLIQDKEISPVDLSKAMLDRIAILEPQFHSYMTITPELAIQQAREAEREIISGYYRGLLHGIPVGVKDLICTEGVRTTCGSKILSDWVPDFDATVIEKLKGAGAVLLGKHNMTEFAGPGYHPSVIPPVHPWSPERWPGASSSGSAVATATSLCFASVGSDTGGSIRHPSAACGIVGVKPTYGRVSRFGVFPLAQSLDTIGPMTRSVRDAAIMLNSIAGFDRRDPTSLRETVPNYLEPLGKEIKGIRIGVDQDYCTAGVDAEVTKAVLAAAKVFVGLGGDIREVKVRSIRDAIMAQHTIFAAEAAAAHERTYPSRALEYGAKFRGILEKGVNTRGLDYAKAYATRQDVTYQFEMLFDEVDLLLCPSMAMTLSLQDFPPYEGPVAEETLLALHQVTAPFSLLGNPTISIPCGFNSQGLPLSLQLVGRHGEESLMMQVAHAYEQSTEWHETRPPCTCQREPREHA